MSKQTAVRLPDEINTRLVNLSQRTGRTVTYYVREAIIRHLDDLEDIYQAEQALERLKKGEDRILDSKEFWSTVED